MDKNSIFNKLDSIFEVAGIDLAKPSAFKEIAPEQEKSALVTQMAAPISNAFKAKGVFKKFGNKTDDQLGKDLKNSKMIGDAQTIQQKFATINNPEQFKNDPRLYSIYMKCTEIGDPSIVAKGMFSSIAETLRDTGAEEGVAVLRRFLEATKKYPVLKNVDERSLKELLSMYQTIGLANFQDVSNSIQDIIKNLTPKG